MNIAHSLCTSYCSTYLETMFMHFITLTTSHAHCSTYLDPHLCILMQYISRHHIYAHRSTFIDIHLCISYHSIYFDTLFMHLYHSTLLDIHLCTSKYIPDIHLCILQHYEFYIAVHSVTPHLQAYISYCSTDLDTPFMHNAYIP